MRLEESDIIDLNYTLNKDFNFLNKFPRNKKIKTIFPSIKSFFLILIKSLIKGHYKYPAQFKSCKFLIVSGSANNDRVLLPIYDSLGNSCIIGGSKGFAIPKFWAYFFSLPYFFRSLRILHTAKGYNRRIFTVYFDLVWLSHGYLKMVDILLKKVKPQYIIVANDHLLPFRAFLKVSKKLNIKTIYVQHAGVAEHFPALTFDYAILDGRCSYEKYLANEKNNTAKVFLAGSPRYDGLASLNNLERDKNVVGMAINLADEIEMVRQAIYLFIDKGFKIRLRLHPGVKKTLKLHYINMINEAGAMLSDPAVESISLFMQKIGFLVANESFIHFEAVLSGVPSFHMKLNKLNGDGYLFLKDGFIKEFNINNIDISISQSQIDYLKYNIDNYEEIRKGNPTINKYNDIFSEIQHCA